MVNQPYWQTRTSTLDHSANPQITNDIAKVVFTPKANVLSCVFLQYLRTVKVMEILVIYIILLLGIILRYSYFT